MSYTDIDEVRGELRIDSRDLIELRDSMHAEIEEIADVFDARSIELHEAIEAIDELADASIEDWEYGAQLIRADAFEDYARDRADVLGAISGVESWPCTCIDWERAARELATDYTSVDFLGHSYYVR